MENKFDESYRLSKTSRSLKENMREIEHKISTNSLVRGVARATAFVSGAVTAVTGFQALQSMNLLDNFQLTPEQYAAIDNAFSGQVTATAIAGVAIAGAVAVSSVLSSIIKSDEKLLGRLEGRQSRVQARINELNKEFNKEEEPQIFDYQKDNEFATNEDKGISGDAEIIKEILRTSHGQGGEREVENDESLDDKQFQEE